MPGHQQSASGGGFDRHVDPGDVNPPAIFEPATSLTLSGAPEVWVAASGGADWGGCVVSISFDGITYSQIGVISARACQGTLTAPLASHADPDTADTLAIDLSPSVSLLPTGATPADADAFRTLLWICPAFAAIAPASGEMIAYGAVAATGTYTSNLTYLRRGLYGTAPAGHAGGDFVTRIDLGAIGAALNAVIVYRLPAPYIGAAFELKFQSFNVFGNETQDIAGVTAWSYTPSGQGYGGGAGGVPTQPAGFLATLYTSTVGLNWNDNPPADNVANYLVQRKLHTLSTWNTIAGVTASVYNDSSLLSNTTNDYRIVAVNAAGQSTPSAVQTVTTNANFN
jgi:hypothetical protein